MINQTSALDGEIINLQEGPDELFVWRDGLEVRIEPLPTEMWHFLKHIQQETNFEQAIERLTATYPDADVASLFASAVSNRWITDFETTN